MYFELESNYDIEINNSSNSSQLKTMKMQGQQTPAPYKTSHPDQFFKTKMCPFLRKNECSRGENCSYAHSEDEVRPMADLSKTQLCNEWKKTGECSIPNCRYAHGHQELRHTGDYFKTAICVHWQQGYCPLNENCRHAHGNYEIKQRVYRWTEKDKDKLKKKNQTIPDLAPSSESFSETSNNSSNHSFSPYSSTSANSSVLNIMPSPNEDRVVVESTYTNIPVYSNWSSTKHNDQMKSNKQFQTLTERSNRRSAYNASHGTVLDELTGLSSQNNNNNKFEKSDDISNIVRDLFKNTNLDLDKRNYKTSDYLNRGGSSIFFENLINKTKAVNNSFSSSLFAYPHDETASTSLPFTSKSSSDSNSFFFSQNDDPQVHTNLLSLINSKTPASIMRTKHNTGEFDINTTSTSSGFYGFPFDNSPQSSTKSSNETTSFHFNALNTYHDEKSTYNSDFPSNFFYDVSAINFSNSFNSHPFLE